MTEQKINIEAFDDRDVAVYAWTLRRDRVPYECLYFSVIEGVRRKSSVPVDYANFIRDFTLHKDSMIKGADVGVTNVSGVGFVLWGSSPGFDGYDDGIFIIQTPEQRVSAKNNGFERDGAPVWNHVSGQPECDDNATDWWSLWFTEPPKKEAPPEEPKGDDEAKVFKVKSRFILVDSINLNSGREAFDVLYDPAMHRFIAVDAEWDETDDVAVVANAKSYDKLVEKVRNRD